MRQMSTLRIEIVSSPETNDHVVRLLVDGVDIVAGLGGIGLDPFDFFFPEPALAATADPTSRTVGRCTCGVPGCGDIDIVVHRDGPCIVWSVTHVPNPAGDHRFDAVAHDAELERARLDHSWETPERTAARLVREGLGPVRARLEQLGLRFDWASGRVEAGKHTVSLTRQETHQQLLVHVDASGSPEVIAAAMLDRLATDLLR
jgi:hypothetical protein